VETVLGSRRGFFGLISEGWDFDDATGKGTRGALPEEASQVERIVGLFDAERGSAATWTAAELNQFAARPITQPEIQRVRELRATLFQQVLGSPRPSARLEVRARRLKSRPLAARSTYGIWRSTLRSRFSCWL
jgi:hypothetical protein